MLTPEKIMQIAEAYTLDAIDHARDNYGITLDFSPSSVFQVEKVLAKLFAAMPTAKAYKLETGLDLDEVLDSYAHAYGFYIGEVFRKEFPVIWTHALWPGGGERIYTLELDGYMVTPIGRVSNRLHNGDEDNVWHYYRIMRNEFQKRVGTPPA